MGLDNDGTRFCPTRNFKVDHGRSNLCIFNRCCKALTSLVIICPKKIWARSIQPKFQPVRPGKLVHLKRWTRFFETFPVGPNRSIEFWTEISGNFGSMDRALLQESLYHPSNIQPPAASSIWRFRTWWKLSFFTHYFYWRRFYAFEIKLFCVQRTDVVKLSRR